MSKKKKNSLSADKVNLVEKEVLNSSEDKKESKKDLSKEKPKSDFAEKIKQSVEGLWYMSETDAEIKAFTGKEAENVTKETLIEQLDISPETNIEELSAADFFQNLTAIQDWFGDEEKETAEKFSALEKLLEENLKELRVFKVGKVEIDIYAVGLDSNNILTGISTKAVET